MKILIVDDNKDITELVSKYLKLSNHECHTSNDARNGLNMIENQKYDAVLLDLAMPNFSGIDVINTLAEKNTIRNQKIIVFTASSKPKSELITSLCSLLKIKEPIIIKAKRKWR